MISRQTTLVNLITARSRIPDADFAAEAAVLLPSQILQQAGAAQVALATPLPQGVLALLRYGVALKEFLKLLTSQIAVAKNFCKQAWPERFASMGGYNR